MVLSSELFGDAILDISLCLRVLKKKNWRASNMDHPLLFFSLFFSDESKFYWEYKGYSNPLTTICSLYGGSSSIFCCMKANSHTKCTETLTFSYIIPKFLFFKLLSLSPACCVCNWPSCWKVLCHLRQNMFMYTVCFRL